MARAKPYRHPLRWLFGVRCFGTVAGMNWLQDRGLVSDNCVEAEDVCSVDVLRVLDAAEASPSLNPKCIAMVREAYERNLLTVASACINSPNHEQTSNQSEGA